MISLDILAKRNSFFQWYAILTTLKANIYELTIDEPPIIKEDKISSDIKNCKCLKLIYEIHMESLALF